MPFAAAVHVCSSGTSLPPEAWDVDADWVWEVLIDVDVGWAWDVDVLVAVVDVGWAWDVDDRALPDDREVGLVLELFVPK